MATEFKSIPIPGISEFQDIPNPIDLKHENVNQSKADKLDRYQPVSINGLDSFGLDSVSNTEKRVTDALDSFENQMLGIETKYQEDLLRKNYSDPNALMSDEFARTGLGTVINTTGALGSAIGSLANTMLSIPQGASDLGASLDNAFDTPRYPAVNLISKYFTQPIFKRLDLTGDVIESAASKLHNDIDLQKLNAEMSNAWDDNSGAVDVFLGLSKTIVADNPAAIPQVIAESLPHMYALAARGSLFAGTFLGMVNQRVKETTDKFIASHEGRKPDATEVGIIFTGAVTSTAIETIESRFLLGKTAKLRSAVNQKTNKFGIRTGRNLGTGAGAEAFQEGSAAYIQEIAGAQTIEGFTSDSTRKETAINAAIGAAAGAPIKATSELSNEISDVAQTAKLTAGKAGAKLVDTVNKKVTTNKAKRLDRAKEEGDNLKVVEIELEANFNALNEEQQLEKLQEIQTNMTELDKQAIAEKDPKKRIELLDKQRKVNTQFNALLNAYDKSVSEAETVIESSEDITPESTQAVNAVIQGMAQGDPVGEATVAKIKGSKLFDILDAGQKNIVDAYDTFQTSMKSLGEVNTDIIKGNTEDGFLGIQDQVKRVSRAVKLGDKEGATLALNQLKNLRDNQVAKLKAPPKNPKFKTHRSKFVDQVTAEANALTAAMNMLDVPVRQAFNESPLKPADLKAPKIELAGGDRNIDLEIADTEAQIKTIRESMKNRPEFGPDAEAAVGAKQEELSRLGNTLRVLKARKNKQTKKPTSDKPVEASEPKAEKTTTSEPEAKNASEQPSEAAIEQLKSKIAEITNEKIRKQLERAFDRATTKAEYTKVRTIVATALRRQKDTADKAKAKSEPIQETTTKPEPEKKETSETEQTSIDFNTPVANSLENNEERLDAKAKLIKEKNEVQNQNTEFEKEISELQKASQTIVDLFRFIRLRVGNEIRSGLNREAFGTDLDSALFKERIGGNRPLFPKEGGLTLANAAEVLNDAGFNPEPIADNDVTEIINEALNGGREYVDFEVDNEINTLQEAINRNNEEIANLEAEIAQIEQDIQANFKPEVVLDNDILVEDAGKVEGFNALADLEIPVKSVYKNPKLKKKIKTTNGAKFTLEKSLPLIRLDNQLKAIQKIVEQCNG